MAGATIAPSLPVIAGVFKNTPEIELLARLILTLPALTIAIFAPLFGLIIERIGKKKVLKWGILLYAISGTTGYYVETIFMILIGRFFLGIAVAAIMTTVLTLIADYFYGNERASFMGIQGSFLAAGGMIYISAGGYLADLDWRAPFLIYLTALVFLPGVFLHLFEPERTVKSHLGDQDGQRNRLPRTVFLILAVAILSMVLVLHDPSPDPVSDAACAQDKQYSGWFRNCVFDTGKCTDFSQLQKV
jgi:MFS family permease